MPNGIRLNLFYPLTKKCSTLQHSCIRSGTFVEMIPGEPLSLVRELAHIDDLIEVYVLLACSLHLSIHNLVDIFLLNVIKVEFYTRLSVQPPLKFLREVENMVK